MTKQQTLAEVTFGQRVAEEEVDQLQKYFVETDDWRRILAGDIDVVYGAKGTGKSAIYALLLSRRDELVARSVVLVSGENPRGAPVFKDLVADPPTSEREFVGLWKLFIVCLIAGALREYGIDSAEARMVNEHLEKNGLIPREKSLRSQLRAVTEYVRAAVRPEAVSAGVEIDQQSGLPKGFTGKITFREPNSQAQAEGFTSVDQLLENANVALDRAGLSTWILLDRLDVAFADTLQLEENALRALFHAYLDLLAFTRIRLKIFLRSDIWKRITQAGFREASHITRCLTISWDSRSLLNLIVSRAVQNAILQELYVISPADVLRSAEAQEAFFYRLCPDQVDVGPNKPRTFAWMLSRTADGTKSTAPRELIHLLNTLREVQVRRLELGETEPEGEQLFHRTAFKEALNEVSRVRIQQTLYAEYPGLKTRFEALRGGKTSHSIETLADAWGQPLEEASATADQLTEVGFFERRGTREEPEYWVPFLYRDGLDLVQGKAEV